MTLGALPRMKTVHIGRMTVDALVDSVGPTRTAEELFAGVQDKLFVQEEGWLVPEYGEAGSERLILAYQSFMITLGDKRILVDCAIGEDGHHPARKDWHHAKSNWLNHLGQCGLSPEDVDTVFLTHLHMDHIGWLTRLDRDIWRPTFPKAVHYATKTELEHWTTVGANLDFMASSVDDCIMPVLSGGLFQEVAPETEIADGLFVVNLAGHSPGMIGLELRENGRVLASFCADLMHHPLQARYPALSTIFCFDPHKAAQVRRRKLTQYAQDKTVVFCGHFPGPSAGIIEVLDEGFRFVPLGQGNADRCPAEGPAGS